MKNNIIKTYIIEYTKPLNDQIWKTEAEAYDRESAVDNFEKEFWGLKVRECYLRKESK